MTQTKRSKAAWLRSFPPRLDVDPSHSAMVSGETVEARQARIFKGLCYDLSLAIDEFGYEAVYFGVGCEVFPDAVDPGWRDGQY